MIRIGLAIAAGFVLWSVLWLGGGGVLRSFFSAAVGADGSVSDRQLLLLLLLLALLASVGSGYLTVLIAPITALRAALILGLLLLLVGIGVQRQYWALLPLWYHLSFLILLLPATLLGGWLRLRF